MDKNSLSLRFFLTKGGYLLNFKPCSQLNIVLERTETHLDLILLAKMGKHTTPPKTSPLKRKFERFRDFEKSSLQQTRNFLRILEKIPPARFFGCGWLLKINFKGSSVRFKPCLRQKRYQGSTQHKNAPFWGVFERFRNYRYKGFSSLRCFTKFTNFYTCFAEFFGFAWR